MAWLPCACLPVLQGRKTGLVWLRCLACSVLPLPQRLHAEWVLLRCAPPRRYNNIYVAELALQ